MPDFDGTPMTKREVLIARAAFVNGVRFVRGTPWDVTEAVRDLEASARYPLPKATRPRVVRDGDHFWRVTGGNLQWRLGQHEWRFVDEYDEIQKYQVLWPTPKRVALWADLLANPTEECDADA